MTITDLRDYEPFREPGTSNSEQAVFINQALNGMVGAETAPWTELAACRNTAGSADLYFSEEVADIVAAKEICTDCPVIAPCLEGALLRGEPCGVWGGQLFDDGKIISQKRRRGRPPKVPRPEDQLPDVPVPAHLQKLIA